MENSVKFQYMCKVCSDKIWVIIVSISYDYFVWSLSSSLLVIYKIDNRLHKQRNVSHIYIQ